MFVGKCFRKNAAGKAVLVDVRATAEVKYNADENLYEVWVGAKWLGSWSRRESAVGFAHAWNIN